MDCGADIVPNNRGVEVFHVNVGVDVEVVNGPIVDEGVDLGADSVPH